MLTVNDIREIELSISFGQRLSAYYQNVIKVMLERSSDDTPKYRQYYERDRNIINDIIECLEQGNENKQYLPFLKKKLSPIGINFFNKEFKELKSINIKVNESKTNRKEDIGTKKED